MRCLIKGAEFTIKPLRVSPQNCLRRLKGSEPFYTVNYTEYHPMKTDSMTNLLKQNNAEISVVKANKILVAMELLENKERPSSKYEGKIKKYKALTSKGLVYGINKENPSSPGQTTPHYYVEKFDELFSLIQKEVSESNCF